MNVTVVQSALDLDGRFHEIIVIIDQENFSEAACLCSLNCCGPIRYLKPANGVIKQADCISAHTNSSEPSYFVKVIMRNELIISLRNDI